MIDHIITRSCYLKDICSVCVLCSAKCNTDRKLVQGKFKLHVRRKVHMARIKIPKCMNVKKMKQLGVHQQLSDALNKTNFDGSWDNFKDQVHITGTDILTKPEETQRLV